MVSKNILIFQYNNSDKLKARIYFQLKNIFRNYKMCKKKKKE